MPDDRPAILLAEDDEHIARLIALKLGREGFRVERARDGADALARLEERSWDLVILDVMMPVRNGWEVLRELRAQPALERLPVVLLSGRSEAPADLDAEALRYVTRVSKPFDPDELARLARELTGGGA